LKILVAVKRVVDHGVRVRPKPDGSAMDIASAKMSLNPFCEIAVEEAVRLKERGIARQVLVASIGGLPVQEQLRSALAMGADSAIHVDTEGQVLEPLMVAKYLRALVVRENPDLVLLGKQSIDGDHNQVGQMLAALCSWPQATFASRIDFKDQRMEVMRELDSGLQTLSISLPAVITTDLRLNQPRYPSIPNIMKARQKPLERLVPADLNVQITPQLTSLGVEVPVRQRLGIKVTSVTELLEKLRGEAKVL
jgi:electron transfer flavoprotein beta subunit